MIGEPEADWERPDGGTRPGGSAPATGPEPAPGSRPTGRGGGGRALAWALVGAVGASALWAGGLYAFRGPLARELTAPRLDHAMPSGSLCAVAGFTALSNALKPFPGQHSDRRPEDPVLTGGSCDRDTRANDDQGPVPLGRAEYSAGIRVELHAVTDPAAEFAVRAREWGTGYGAASDEVRAVPGLGDEALLFDTGGETHTSYDLVVREGGAVFTTWVRGRPQGEGERSAGPAPFADPVAVQSALVEDTRAIMEALRIRD
ncbi:hypothetical protein ACN20G_07960 [Streptomyces sp. BI20]|uniref:hypothetical protein n=1 Tax=Streptomyces sp. BI20 TaxID=3403460 RepID=UPI003C730289